MMEQRRPVSLGNELSAQEFALAIAIFVSHRRTRKTRRQRLATSYIEDVFDVLDNPAVNPKVRRLVDGSRHLEDLKRARLCDQTRTLFESIETVLDELSQAIDEE